MVKPGVNQLAEGLRTGGLIVPLDLGHQGRQLSFGQPDAGSAAEILGLDRLGDPHQRTDGPSASEGTQSPHARSDLDHRALHIRNCGYGVVTGESASAMVGRVGLDPTTLGLKVWSGGSQDSSRVTENSRELHLYPQHYSRSAGFRREL